MRNSIDTNRREVTAGDWVYVKLYSHKQISVAKRISPKLSVYVKLDSVLASNDTNVLGKTDWVVDPLEI